MELKARHWLIALVGAVAVHLSLLTLFERPDEPVTPVRGILIELAYGSDAPEAAPGPESPSPPDTGDLSETDPAAVQTLEPDAVSEVQPEKPEPPEPEPPADPIAPAETFPVPDAEPVVAESPAPAKPKTSIRPKVQQKEQKKARSTKRKKKAPNPRHGKKIAKPGTRKAAGSSGGGSPGKGSGKRGTGTGSGASAAAARNRYTGQISAWLNRNKRYPKRARSRGHQGSVTVRFTVDRDGRVLSSSIVRSSGYATLDDEVRALMRRGRMPRMPAAMKKAQMTLIVPIRFRLR